MVAERARHVEEVIYGKLRGAENGRPDYVPETTGLLERQLRKSNELKENGQDVSPKIMRRRVQAYRQSGPAGLLDQRSGRHTTALGSLDVRMKDALISVISRATDESTMTVTTLIVYAQAEVFRRHPGEDVPVPSDRSLHHHIKVLTRGKYTTGNSTNRRSVAIAPGHEVQTDSSRLDVLVLDDDGKPMRAKLTIMLDKATQSIIGSSINVRGTTGIEFAFLLAQCLTPRPARPMGG